MRAWKLTSIKDHDVGPELDHPLALFDGGAVIHDCCMAIVCNCRCLLCCLAKQKSEAVIRGASSSSSSNCSACLRSASSSGILNFARFERAVEVEDARVDTEAADADFNLSMALCNSLSVNALALMPSPSLVLKEQLICVAAARAIRNQTIRKTKHNLAQALTQAHAYATPSF